MRSSYSCFSKISSLAPPCADRQNTCHRTPFSLPMPALTPTTRWPWYCSSYCVLGKTATALERAAKEQRSKVYTLLLQSFVWAIRSLKKNGTTSTAVKNILGFVNIKDDTRNHKFKRLEPQCHISATRSRWKETSESAVALPHSRECAKELISALPNYGSKEKFGARAELLNVLQEKNMSRCGSNCQVDRLRFFFCGQCNTGGYSLGGADFFVFVRVS